MFGEDRSYDDEQAIMDRIEVLDDKIRSVKRIIHSGNEDPRLTDVLNRLVQIKEELSADLEGILEAVY